MTRKLERGDARLHLINQARHNSEKKRRLAEWENSQTSGAFCPQCAKRRPVDRQDSTCIPCANAGHSVRLVEADTDRLSRVALWGAFYDAHGYTEKERLAIPHFQNLIGLTVE